VHEKKKKGKIEIFLCFVNNF